MKNRKIEFVISGFVSLILLVVLYSLNQAYQKNKCFNLNMDKIGFSNSIDKCYVSGIINKERKDYLEDKYNKKIKDQISTQINESIIFDYVNLTSGDQYVLHLSSGYCSDRSDYCNGCMINFYNNDIEGDKNIVFIHTYQNSGMNFINKSKFDLLNKFFCFNLDCGQGKSPAFCLDKP